MSVHENVAWDWGDTKVHPAIQYPSSWVSGGDASTTGLAQVVGMIKSFNPRITTPKDVINSLNDYNQGFVSKPPEYYVDLTLAPYGTAYEQLLACLNGDRYFDVVLAPITDYGVTLEGIEVGQPPAAWGPVYEVFRGCKITDLNERYAMGTEPTVTFTCRALRFAWGAGDSRKEFGNGYAGRTITDTLLGLTGV